MYREDDFMFHDRLTTVLWGLNFGTFKCFLSATDSHGWKNNTSPASVRSPFSTSVDALDSRTACGTRDKWFLGCYFFFWVLIYFVSSAIPHPHPPKKTQK
jgi:hypothetical protein